MYLHSVHLFPKAEGTLSPAAGEATFVGGGQLRFTVPLTPEEVEAIGAAVKHLPSVTAALTRILP